MKKFWGYVFFASGAIVLAATSPSQSESRAWIVGLWAIFGCFPWSFLLPIVLLPFIPSIPNAQFTLVHITAMSTLNALLLYAMCQAKLQNMGLLRYIGYQFGRCASRLRT